RVNRAASSRSDCSSASRGGAAELQSDRELAARLTRAPARVIRRARSAALRIRPVAGRSTTVWDSDHRARLPIVGRDREIDEEI
ncbi:hypothetical protein, partial [Methylobacterium sp. WL18]|uniref:hypothetical protein n=1 Tax=Methylobacterium sp. WL18 TaxID=2603897 RepID=UPI001AEE3051